MATTQPPLIVAIDGEAKVSVRSTPTDPVNVKFTNDSLKVKVANDSSASGVVPLVVSNSSIDTPPSPLSENGKTIKMTLHSATASIITVKTARGSWLEVNVKLNSSEFGTNGWINTNAITGDTFVLWVSS
jgi:hypothetical protein